MAPKGGGSKRTTPNHKPDPVQVRVRPDEPMILITIGPAGLPRQSPTGTTFAQDNPQWPRHPLYDPGPGPGRGLAWRWIDCNGDYVRSNRPALRCIGQQSDSTCPIHG